MQIPLDYYKILGVPSGSDMELLEQAYRDRLLQMPRGDYSEEAINQRKEILDKAYQVLSNKPIRTEYDQQFFPPPPPLQEVELDGQIKDENQLQEVELDREIKDENQPVSIKSPPLLPYIEVEDNLLPGALALLVEVGEYENAIKIGNDCLHKLDKKSFKEDVLISVVCAHLEQGREQWQRREYEKAAIALNQGRDLLLKEGLLSSLNEEIKAELQKLRPYRILELLSYEEDKIAERLKGLQLLKQMLQERRGIDGKGDDQSGLGVDDFLRFVQQLQTYLSVTEQQEIFEAEAQRPSAVGTYLAFYAFLAKGFAHKKPELIYRATEMLHRLKKRQDMWVEEAVCALLLGKTQEATQALKNTKEQETLEFIEQNSQGAPDLLPGLCLYTERWLQTEVFSHFRDLSKHKASLDEYFGDIQVQRYLDELASFPQAPTEKEPIAPKPRSKKTFLRSNTTDVEGKNSKEESPLQTTEDVKLLNILTKGNSEQSTEKVIVAETIREPSRRSWRRRNTEKPQSDLTPQTIEESEVLSTPPVEEQQQPKKKPRMSLLLFGLIFVGFFSVMGIMALLAIQKLFPPKPERLSIDLNSPPVAIPVAKPKPVAQKPVEKPLTVVVAKQLVEKWLDAKSKAFGKNHQIDALKTILVEPFLSKAKAQGQQLKATNAYRLYQHSVDSPSFKINPQNPNQATIEATVTENSQFYNGGVLNPSESYNSKLKVRYELSRNNQTWFIKDVKVLP